MKKRFLWIFIMAVIFAAATYGNCTEAKAATDLGVPENVKVYNPELDTIYLKWSKVSGAAGYFVYISTDKNSGYKIINVGADNHVVIKGNDNRTRYYFKVKAYDSIGVVSEDSEIVTRKGRIFGVDVSYHNGSINWEEAKPNIDFAILRVGYGDNITSQDDSMWYQNANECTRLGIPFGVYIYSYATSTAQASSEADHVLRLIQGYTLKCPVYYDMEDAGTTGLVSASVKGDIAQTFCDKITAAGYSVGIYANKNWFTYYLTDSRFNSWERWVAQYNDTCTYTGMYKLWQFTSDGSVPGISGRVDSNYWFSGRKYDLTGKKNINMNSDGVYLGIPQNVSANALSTSKVKVTWSGVDGSTRYIVYRKKKGDTRYFRAAVTIGTQFEDTALSPGQTYIYKVCAYTGIGGVEYFGEFSNNVKVTTYPKLTTELRASQVDKNSIKLTWNLHSKAVLYKIYRYDSSQGKYVKLGTTVSNSYVDTANVQTGVLYKYRLYAKIKEANGFTYTTCMATETGIAGAADVKNFKASSKSARTVTLSWSKATGATRYQIFYSGSKNGSYKRLCTLSGTGKSYTVRNLKSGKRYYFKIRSGRSSDGILLTMKSISPVSVVVK